jgi:hypothetical protein
MMVMPDCSSWVLGEIVVVKWNRIGMDVVVTMIVMMMCKGNLLLLVVVRSVSSVGFDENNTYCMNDTFLGLDGSW